MALAKSFIRGLERGEALRERQAQVLRQDKIRQEDIEFRDQEVDRRIDEREEDFNNKFDSRATELATVYAGVYGADRAQQWMDLVRSGERVPSTLFDSWNTVFGEVDLPKEKREKFEQDLLRVTSINNEKAQEEVIEEQRKSRGTDQYTLAEIKKAQVGTPAYNAGISEDYADLDEAIKGGNVEVAEALESTIQLKETRLKNYNDSLLNDEKIKTEQQKRAESRAKMGKEKEEKGFDPTFTKKVQDVLKGFDLDTASEDFEDQLQEKFDDGTFTSTIAPALDALGMKVTGGNQAIEAAFATTKGTPQDKIAAVEKIIKDGFKDRDTFVLPVHKAKLKELKGLAAKAKSFAEADLETLGDVIKVKGAVGKFFKKVIRKKVPLPRVPGLATVIPGARDEGVLVKSVSLLDLWESNQKSKKILTDIITALSLTNEQVESLDEEVNK